MEKLMHSVSVCMLHLLACVCGMKATVEFCILIPVSVTSIYGLRGTENGKKVSCLLTQVFI